jgi:hypothetical protein
VEEAGADGETAVNYTGNCIKQQIFSADKMALSWKKMLPRTVIAKEEKLESDFKTD